MATFGTKANFSFEKEYGNVYIHVPFCRNKCGYCAFYSVTGALASREMQERWLERVAGELGRYKYSSPLKTLYFGGGTPTFLDSVLLGKLRDICCKLLPLDADTEISMETNPETVDDEKFSILKGFVNRLSVGVQSFDTYRRELLGRDCSEKQIMYALAKGRELFPRLNADLIYALPVDEEEIWQKELETACAAGCDHLSCYEITPEDDAWKKFPSPPEDLSLRLWRLTGEFLASRGIHRYEISNYSRPGCQCRHNANVWQGELLCGVGPSAAGFNGTVRWIEKADIALWLAHTRPEIDEITPRHRTAEIISVGLRRTAGWPKKEIISRFGKEAAASLDRARTLLPQLWTEDPEIYALSEEGLLLWSSVAALLLAE